MAQRTQSASTSNRTSPRRQPSAPRRQPASSRRSSTSSRKPSGKAPMSGGVRNLGVALVFIVAAVIAYLVSTAKESGKPIANTVATTAGKLMEVKNPKGLREEIIQYTGMTVSFNSDTHEPNWVAWELLGSEVSGESGREPGFLVDAAIDGCATPDDYRLTGFDRGHMAPAGDMKWHPQAMRESFNMTNICPQSPDLNRGAWKKLEEKCRQRAETDSSLIIICGPVFDKSGPAARIGATGVAVPQKFFKVILAPFVGHPWAIGFIMPNGYVAGGMQKTAVPVDEVEALTGYDFFSALPDSIENDIEARCDFNSFSRLPRRR